MSWIALTDVISIIDFLITHEHIAGAVNLVAPHCVNQTEFAKTLASALHRPALFKVPKTVLQLLLGEMADLLLDGQHVKPSVLSDNGYQFIYDQLSDAIHHCV